MLGIQEVPVGGHRSADTSCDTTTRVAGLSPFKAFVKIDAAIMFTLFYIETLQIGNMLNSLTTE